MARDRQYETYGMTQPKLMKSSDERGRALYHCIIEVYNTRTRQVCKTCKGSGRSVVEACKRAADEGLQFLRDLPDEEVRGRDAV